MPRQEVRVYDVVGAPPCRISTVSGDIRRVASFAARQWIPAEHLAAPGTRSQMGIADGLVFRTKGQLAIDICTDAYADGVVFDFVCGDEVYGCYDGCVWTGPGAR